MILMQLKLENLGLEKNIPTAAGHLLGAPCHPCWFPGTAQGPHILTPPPTFSEFSQLKPFAHVISSVYLPYKLPDTSYSDFGTHVPWVLPRLCSHLLHT